MKTNRGIHDIYYKMCMLLVTVCMLVACTKEADIEIHTTKVHTTTYKVAVVLPFSDVSNKARYERSVNWALENLRSAQNLVLAVGDTTAVDIELEWYDEDTEDLSPLAHTLSQRDDILLTIGPLTSEHVNIMAPAFYDEDKPLISPSASSEDIIRRYSVGTGGVKYKRPFLWTMCETDVSQSEALLAKAWEGGATKVALLAPADYYGQTFTDWVPFQATEMNMQLTATETFTKADDLAQAAQTTLASGAECVVCVVHNVDEAKTVLEQRRLMGDKAPRVLFSEEAMSASLTSLGSLAEGAEGVAPYADPQTGFQIAYEERFATMPTVAEAQLYDATLLAGFTAFSMLHTDGKYTANQLLSMMTTLGDENYPVWNELGMRSLLMLLKQGKYVKMVGACGPLRFDAESYTSMVESTYVHWMVYNNQLISIDYRSSDGSRRVSSTLASWNWQARQQQTIVDEDAGIVYSPLGSHWAVLVQGSTGWENYRHHADVLNIYQLLKRNGWPDDHIILILSDDIAQHANNKYKGEVRAYANGDDLYAGAEIDYSTDTLTVNDIADILTGQRSQHLPTVLNADGHSNVLVFWSGHGCKKGSKYAANGFLWRDKTVFTDNMLRQTLETMHNNNRYRKMLALFEPCYSQSMTAQTMGIDGILGIASATSSESSFADYHSADLNTWMSDRFTNNIVSVMLTIPTATFRDMYLYLARRTLGSHVRIDNASHYGNLYITSPQEFFSYDVQ